MNTTRNLTYLLVASGLATVGCLSTQPDPTMDDTTDPTLSDPTGGKADGFGIDMIFNNLIAGPNVIARTACPDFNFAAGERLEFFAQSRSLTVYRINGTIPAIKIRVPSQGNYIWEGQSPNRSTSEIVSNVLHLHAFMNTQTSAVSIEKLGATARPPCVLARCPAFGLCQ